MGYPEKNKLVYSRWDFPRENVDYENMIGKNLLFYDEHHGSANHLIDANLDDIRRLDDDYTSIILLD